MKFFASIMAILILAQSVMPCGDKESPINEGQSKNGLTKANNHENDQRDDCSPFCGCSCCAGIAYLAAPMRVSFLTAPMAPVYSTTITAYTLSIALPIWQPPQLV